MTSPNQPNGKIPNSPLPIRRPPSRHLSKLALGLALGTAGLWALYARAAHLSYAPPPQAIAATLCLPRCSDTEPIHLAPAGENGPGGNRLGEGRSLQSLLPPDFNPDNISILIEKAEHRLTVYHQLQPIKSYPVVFGGAPVGDKRYEGDRKTPEGILRVKDRYPHPDWSKFIWLDYPNPNSWRRHIAAKLQGKIPLSATVGSDLGIHGVPANHRDIIERRINWTLGCPSLKNEDVDEIYQVIQVGTLVEIRP